MEKAQHDNIVQLKSHWLNDSGRLCILMELCTSGSLQQLINKHAKMKKTIAEVRCKFYMEELAGALSYLHDAPPLPSFSFPRKAIHTPTRTASCMACTTLYIDRS